MDTGTAVGIAALVPSIFGLTLPPIAEVRRDADNDGHLRAAVTTAAVTSAVMVSAVAVTTGERSVLFLGGAATLAFMCLYLNAWEVQAWQL